MFEAIKCYVRIMVFWHVRTPTPPADPVRRSPRIGMILAAASETRRGEYLGRRACMTQRGHAHYGKRARITRPMEGLLTVDAI